MLKTCLGIFGARFFDVTLGTLKTVYSVKGKMTISSIIAFVEIYIWFLVAKEALNSEINSALIPFSYALGYAFGTFSGTFIANRFIKSELCIKVITKKLHNDDMIKEIKDHGYGMSIISLRNVDGREDKEMLFIEINKKSLEHLISIIKKHDKDAFLIADETKLALNGTVK